MTTWTRPASCDTSACVELSESPEVVILRSSLHPERTVEFTRAEWDAFVAALRGERVGICGAVMPDPFVAGFGTVCDLPAGHKGWHGGEQPATGMRFPASRVSWRGPTRV